MISRRSPFWLFAGEGLSTAQSDIEARRINDDVAITAMRPAAA